MSYIHTYIHTSIHTYIPPYIRTYIHTYIHSGDKIPECDYRRQVKLQGAREIHWRKGICNTDSIDEDDAKYWRTKSIQKEDNFGSSNVDNAVCLPNTVGGTLRGDR